MEGFLNPNEIFLSHLELQKDMVACDFGCGSGGWALPLAKILEDGKVYAIDILEEPLSALRSKTQLEKISNIETIHSNVESKNGSTLPEASCDLVLMTNLLFQAENKKPVLEEGKRVLKKGAKLLIVDWKKDVPLGPKEGRVSAEEVKKIAEELSLKLNKEFKAGLHHWGLIFEKR